MEDKCLFNHKISFSKANELKCFKRKRNLNWFLNSLYSNFPGQLHAFLSSSRAIFNSWLLSVSFYFRSEAVTGCGSRVTGGCAGTAIAADMPNHLRPRSALRSPGHCRHRGPSMDLLSGCWAATFQSSQTSLSPLPRIGKECSVSVLKCKFT